VNQLCDCFFHFSKFDVSGNITTWCVEPLVIPTITELRRQTHVDIWLKQQVVATLNWKAIKSLTWIRFEIRVFYKQLKFIHNDLVLTLNKRHNLCVVAIQLRTSFRCRWEFMEYRQDLTWPRPSQFCFFLIRATRAALSSIMLNSSLPQSTVSPKNYAAHTNLVDKIFTR